MNNTIEITDSDSFKRRKVKNLKITNYPIPDKKTGEETLVKCVEYTVMGSNNEWKDYAIYDEFKKVNPENNLIE